jgi:hypothetical protein
VRLKTEGVFKFCFRADRVRSLKREAALFGLLKERVGRQYPDGGRQAPGCADLYKQSLKIHQILAEQDKTKSVWQRDLIVSLYKMATTMSKIGGDDDRSRAREIFQEALNLTDKCSGNDRQQLIDALNQALQQLLH